MLHQEVLLASCAGLGAICVSQPLNLELRLVRVIARHIVGTPCVPRTRWVDTGVLATIQRVVAQAAHQFVAQGAADDQVITRIAIQIILISVCALNFVAKAGARYIAVRDRGGYVAPDILV